MKLLRLSLITKEEGGTVTGGQDIINTLKCSHDVYSKYELIRNGYGYDFMQLIPSSVLVESIE